MRRDIGEPQQGHIPNDGNNVDRRTMNGANSVSGVHESISSSSKDEHVDVLIVGAGFAGVFTVKAVEAGSDLGGVWHWNRYPGARVDSQYPVYCYSLPEVYEDWNWTTEFPDWEELQRYFQHVDKKLGIKKDTVFKTKVTSADFDTTTDAWTIKCDTGKIYYSRCLIASTGFAAKRYIPDYDGLDSFEGIMHHSSFWPTEPINVRGLRVGVLGSGSTGIQIAQEWAKEIGETGDLKLFQRTPNLCCPMRQKSLTPEQQTEDKTKYREWFNQRWNNYGGFLYQYRDSLTFDQTPEQRQALYEELWTMGGFRFLMNNYFDMTRDVKANREAYNFWRDKVRLRIKDLAKADLLAPIEPPHPFGAKRVALEQGFYDEFNKPNVNVFDIKTYPIIRFEPEGIRTSDGTLHKLDVIAIATGFDSITGGLKDISIKGLDEELLSSKWGKGTWTYLGMATARFLNFFFTYGPQAPTAFSNGPACIELQADWLVDLLVHMREMGYRRVDAQNDAEQEWRITVNDLSARGLRHTTDSWYNGSNIPGKPREPLNYAGGLPLYRKTLTDVKDHNYKGFEMQ
ncbi:uncharacterized protein A1O5_01591 [Cladophialophora psammophila CBS 110553]|uniref:Uncharacterized protein n=1 Tax=Cladophialophora psammophila CBS 110553 TaxID=1182543 RepID=W9XC62_9EURO|nr:uncharacterized protein A1O5_01591 [Cladophialophora psammophila CBS 110553]EXJ74895.1 hypothetical protein A1O5_01591 [Cladophialophora psammophila CBS 110553]